MKKDVNDTCKTLCINKKKVSYVKKKMKSEATMQRVSETFKVLGDQTRSKIVFALLLEELCVCDLANLLGATSSAVSHQLRVLRNMRFVKYRKNGKITFYSLDDEHIKNLFEEGIKHVEEFS